MASNVNPKVTLPRVRGNREPIGAILQENDGTAIDLTGKSVTFRMVNESTGLVVVDDKAADIDGDQTANTGKVSYTPEASEVDFSGGRFAMYFRTNDNPQQRFPYDGAKFVLQIVEECRAAP